MHEITLRDGLEHYRKHVSILKKGYQQEKYRIEQIARSFLGEKLASEATSVDIATYRDQRLATINPRTKRALSPSTVRLEMSLLSNFFEIGRIEWGFCGDNPVKNVRKPKSPPGRDRLLTAREERLIFRYCTAHNNRTLYSIIALALETAMRQGEILSLCWEHINLKTRIAHLPETKNGTKRDVPLSIKARDALIRLGVKSKGRVFEYTSNGLKSTWRFMIQRLEIKNLHFHDLRHAAITRLVELGSLDILEVAAISGHKSLAMLKRYTHLRAQKLVRKLEGNRTKGKQAVIDHLVPYPAVIDREAELFKVRLLDFEGITAEGSCMASAIENAQSMLLRQILIRIKGSLTIPEPDQYLEMIEDSRIVMIDPLSTEDG